MLARLMKFRELVLVLGAVLAAVLYWLACPGIENVVLHRQGQDSATKMPVSLSMDDGEIKFR